MKQTKKRFAAWEKILKENEPEEIRIRDLKLPLDDGDLAAMKKELEKFDQALQKGFKEAMSSLETGEDAEPAIKSGNKRFATEITGEESRAKIRRVSASADSPAQASTSSMTLHLTFPTLSELSPFYMGQIMLINAQGNAQPQEGQGYVRASAIVSH